MSHDDDPAPAESPGPSLGVPGDSEAGSDASAAPTLSPVLDGDWRLGPPSRVTATPVDPQLALLPTHEMEWPDFERLLVRVAREVQGLRAVRLFGNPGQAQHGLDAVGINASGDPEGVQGKKYQSFTVIDLEAAVAKFLNGSLPFVVQRLAVGVSCRANERKVIERLTVLNSQHRPIEFELWDRDRLSEMLRGRPEIVREFFGADTAARFCIPHRITPVEVPGPDAVSTADAVMLGPTASGAAKTELDAADRLSAGDPAGALDHVQRAQALLVEAGFFAHAEVLDVQVINLLNQLGRATEAERLLLDRFWTALDSDRSFDAEAAVRDLAQLAKTVGASDADETSPNVIMASARIAEAALHLSLDPLGNVPDFVSLPEVAVESVDSARLVLLAAETALADGSRSWLSGHVEAAMALSEQMRTKDEALAVRLELVVADATGNWTTLVHRARTRAVDRSHAALILARHARHLAVNGDHQQADLFWTEAVEQGCLARRNEDAADWIYSRRQLAVRYTAILGDAFHPLAAALTRRPTLPRVATLATRTREQALEAIQSSKPRVAALRLRRYLRDAVVSGSWQDERDARNLLADVYLGSNELARAARQLILAGNAKQANKVGKNVGDIYIDVLDYLSAPTYWTVAAAFSFIAAQGDLLPDHDVDGVATQALIILDQARLGTLVDTPFFDPSVNLAAHQALAAIASRLKTPEATRLLDFLAPLTLVEEGHYRHTDDTHAATCASIGKSLPTLTSRALDQLMILFARASHSVKTPARELLVENLPLVQVRLEELAVSGNSAAAELLAYARPDTVEPAQAEAAAQALLRPLENTPGHYSIGTDAVQKSLLAARLPAKRRADLVRQQLQRARSPYESALDRTDYLLAAANLAHDLPDADVEALLPLALVETAAPAPSEVDDATAAFNHPLGVMRVTGGRDSRPAASLLAARLARTPEQREQARLAALALIGADGDADYYVTRALQTVKDDLERDVPWLASLGWALRSLAAISWAESATLPAGIGEGLAVDPDARVRRALADALAQRESNERTTSARDILMNDPRNSVRRIIAGLMPR